MFFVHGIKDNFLCKRVLFFFEVLIWFLNILPLAVCIQEKDRNCSNLHFHNNFFFHRGSELTIYYIVQTLLAITCMFELM